MRPSRARLVLVLATSSLVIATPSCTKEPILDERAIVVYSPRACPIDQAEAFAVVYAGGDFEASADQAPVARFFLRDLGQGAALPETSRAFIVDVSQRDAAWRGLANVGARGPVNVLVWPSEASCSLGGDIERRTGTTLGVVGRQLLVAGGRAEGGSQVPHTFVGDLSTGLVVRLPFGLGTRRSNPSVTEFRSSTDPDGPSPALVAGGHDPDSDTPDVPLRALATAEIYVPKIGAPSDIGDFDRERIDLSEPRARHGAVVLASGETLLVGGRGPNGPLRTMEIIDPASRRTHTAGVALLSVARESPTVLRLASGEILVAGGLDAEKAEVPTLEWFSPDASRPTKRPSALVTGVERAFVPLEAGGALAVVKPAGNTPGFKSVWVISADGTLDAGEPIDPSVLDTVRLFAGTEGAPMLWTGQRWMRWSPWLGRFETVANGTAPGGLPTGPRLDVANGDPGLALWLDDRENDGMSVVGYRFATRMPFAAVPAPLLIDGTTHLAPDRLATAATSIRFDAELGLVLGSGASAFLTDLTFANVTIDLDITSNAPTIVLRPERGTELEVGGASCAFAQTAKTSLRVVRSGRTVTVIVDGAAARACPVELEPNVRVSIGLRGSGSSPTSAARNLRVARR